MDDFETIKARALVLVQEDSKRDGLYDALESLWLLEDAETPQGQADYTTRSPTPFTVPRQIGNILAGNAPVIRVIESAETEAAKVKSGRIKAGLDALLFRANQNGENLVGQLVTMAVVYGRAVMKVMDMGAVWAMQEMSEEEISAETDAGALPYALLPCHPRMVHTFRGPHRVDHVVEVTQRRLRWVRSYYGDKAGFIKGEDDELGDYYEYWDHKVNCAWWGNDDSQAIIGPVEYNGIIPYCDFPCSAQFFLNRSDLESPSFLYPLYATRITRRLNLAYTIWANNAVKLGNSGFAFYTRSGEAPEMKLDVPGASVGLYTDERMTPLHDARIAPILAQLYTNLKADEEMCTLSRVISGNAPGGVTAGYAIGVLGQGAASVLSPIKGAVEACLADALRKVVRRVKLSGEPLEVWGERKLTTLKPQDLDEHQHIEVAIKPRLPQDRMQEANVAGYLQRLGSVSQETILEDILGMDAELERQRTIVETALEALKPLRILAAAEAGGWVHDDGEREMLRERLGLTAAEQHAKTPRRQVAGAVGNEMPGVSPEVAPPAVMGQEPTAPDAATMMAMMNLTPGPSPTGEGSLGAPPAELLMGGPG